MTALQSLRLEDYFSHIREAAQLVRSYIQGMDKQAFSTDKRTQQAVIYNIMIIGEVASQLINKYPEIVEATPEVPWKEMRGIRNRMAHGYFEVSIDIVWATATTDMEKLITQTEIIENSLNSRSPGY